MATPRKRPRQQRSRQTVEVVLEAAAQVFLREGVAATTNRIAERAGVSIGTLYQYFPNKQALLYALAERHVADVQARLTEVFATLREHRPPLQETLRLVVTEIVDAHADRPQLHALLEAHTPRVAEGVARVGRLRAWCAEEVAFHLSRCERGGPDPEARARAIVNLVDAQLHRAPAERDRQLAELLPLVHRLID